MPMRHDEPTGTKSRIVPGVRAWELWAVLTVSAAAAWMPPTEAASPPSSPPAGPALASPTPAATALDLSGRVLDPNGQPVAGAQVGLNGDGTPVRVYNGVLKVDWPTPVLGIRIIKTGTDGRFYLEDTWPDPFYVLAAHERGFALVSGKEFKKNQEIRLQRWGRIEGQLAKGRQGSDHRIWMLGLPNPAWLWQQLAFRYDTPDDKDGRFVFEKVPAGWFEIAYLTPLGDDYEGLTSRTPVEVKAGETTKVKLGGQGRPVIGRSVPPASYGKPVYFGAGIRALTAHEKLDRKQERWRQQWEQASEQDIYTPHGAPVLLSRMANYGLALEGNRRKLDLLWSEPPAHDVNVDYALWSDVNWRGYVFRINSDGAFRIEDVVPGKYELRVELKERKHDSDLKKPFAEYHATIEIPPMGQTYTEEPLDLGNLTLGMHGAGDPTPAPAR
jgi:hypothetical protein